MAARTQLPTHKTAQMAHERLNNAANVIRDLVKQVNANTEELVIARLRIKEVEGQLDNAVKAYDEVVAKVNANTAAVNGLIDAAAKATEPEPKPTRKPRRKVAGQSVQ
jgi:predicted S18 family serine protease